MTKRIDDTVENLRVAMDNTDRAKRLGEAASVELTLAQTIRRAFCIEAKGPSPPSPKMTGLNPLCLACEKESVANHNSFFTIERNSVRQI
jgi:hypothetical protein